MIELQVNAMHCGSCVASITRAVKLVDGQAAVMADLAAHTVRVESALPPEKIRLAVENAGFDVDSLVVS